jgi:hypothetical protein
MVIAVFDAEIVCGDGLESGTVIHLDFVVSKGLQMTVVDFNRLISRSDQNVV